MTGDRDYVQPVPLSPPASRGARGIEPEGRRTRRGRPRAEPAHRHLSRGGRMPAMRRSSATILLMFAATSLSVGCARDRCVTFDPQSLGAQFPPPAPPGVIFTEQGIPVSIQDFQRPGGATTVGTVRIASPTSGVGSGNVVNINNANLEFNLTSVPNTQVQFKFVDLGGYENL